jgi:hypothetical protein
LKQNCPPPMKLEGFVSVDQEKCDEEQNSLVPLNHLLEGVVLTTIGREAVRVDETTERVTTEVSAVRVELSPGVVLLEVDLGLVNETDDLHVVRGLHELDTLESAGGDETSTATGLGAPRDFLVLSLTDGSRTVGGCPEAEVYIYNRG